MIHLGDIDCRRWVCRIRVIDPVGVCGCCDRGADPPPCKLSPAYGSSGNIKHEHNCAHKFHRSLQMDSWTRKRLKLVTPMRQRPIATNNVNGGRVTSKYSLFISCCRSEKYARLANRRIMMPKIQIILALQQASLRNEQGKWIMWCNGLLNSGGFLGILPLSFLYSKSILCFSGRKTNAKRPALRACRDSDRLRYR